jgi:hypothetical protein
MSEFSDQSIARKLEISFQSALIVGLGHRSIYRSNEDGERLLPCIVLKAEQKQEDLSFRYLGRPAQTIELRAAAHVSTAGENSSRAVETMAQSLRTAIETATIGSGWNYLRLEYAGSEKAADNTTRSITHIYQVTAHA